MGRLLIPGVLSLALAGCGGSPPPSGAGHDDFREIQQQEATIERHRLDATEDDRSCDRACPAVTTICTAAERICEIAEDTGDRDALLRCERARDTCREVTGRARDRCGCEQ